LPPAIAAEHYRAAGDRLPTTSHFSLPIAAAWIRAPQAEAVPTGEFHTGKGKDWCFPSPAVACRLPLQGQAFGIHLDSLPWCSL